MKRFLALSLLVSFFCLIPVSFKRLTCGFKLAKMRLEIPFRNDWEISLLLPKEEVLSILSQPFSYLDRGAQCYVFESQDGRYVIKLFRYDQSLFFKKKKKKRLGFNLKIEKLFSACILAYTKAKDETGVLFLHLNPTKKEYPILQAKGPIGQSLKIPLDRYRFAIQKKVTLFEETLLRAYRLSDGESMKRCIDSLVVLLKSRANKGIRNSDPSLTRNFGFLGEQAFEIDFGNYSEEPFLKEKEVLRYAKKLRCWLKDNAPEWVSYLDESADLFR